MVTMLMLVTGIGQLWFRRRVLRQPLLLAHATSTFQRALDDSFWTQVTLVYKPAWVIESYKKTKLSFDSLVGNPLPPTNTIKVEEEEER